MSESSGSNIASSGLGFFGLWQVLYFTLYAAIDAPWNKVQNWPFFDWWNVSSVAFPTVLSVTLALIAIVCAIIWVAVTD